MAATEIEKLERRYAENPQGLTFAPLAEIHRKNGDVARALELLRAGLELHPNYIPASIVLGRCHWDLGDLPAAESAFSHVLRLDDENVIALKSLADINEKLGRVADAQRWLNRLISVDRSNEEARQQLARLELGKSQPPAPAAAALPDVPALEAESARPEPAPAAPPEPAPPQPSAAPLDLAVELTEPVPAASSKAPGKAEAPPAEEPAPAPVLEFIDTSAPGTPSQTPPEGPTEPKPVDGLISQEFVPPRDTYRSHPELTQDFVSPTEPPRSREDELGDLEVEMMEEVELQSSGASEFRVPNAAEDFMEAAAAPSPPAPPQKPSPVSAAPPRIEPKSTPPEAPPEPTRKSYSVQETRGQSVAAFFAALLSARPSGVGKPSAAAGSSPAPAPGPLAGAEVSFDDFFGTAEPSRLPETDADPGKEDLDQFQSWLQNLKR